MLERHGFEMASLLQDDGSLGTAPEGHRLLAAQDYSDRYYGGRLRVEPQNSSAKFNYLAATDLVTGKTYGFTPGSRVSFTQGAFDDWYHHNKGAYTETGFGQYLRELIGGRIDEYSPEQREEARQAYSDFMEPDELNEQFPAESVRGKMKNAVHDAADKYQDIVRGKHEQYMKDKAEWRQSRHLDDHTHENYRDVEAGTSKGGHETLAQTERALRGGHLARGIDAGSEESGGREIHLHNSMTTLKDITVSMDYVAGNAIPVRVIRNQNDVATLGLTAKPVIDSIKNLLGHGKRTLGYEDTHNFNQNRQAYQSVETVRNYQNPYFDAHRNLGGGYSTIAKAGARNFYHGKRASEERAHADMIQSIRNNESFSDWLNAHQEFDVPERIGFAAQLWNESHETIDTIANTEARQRVVEPPADFREVPERNPDTVGQMVGDAELEPVSRRQTRPVRLLDAEGGAPMRQIAEDSLAVAIEAKENAALLHSTPAEINAAAAAIAENASTFPPRPEPAMESTRGLPPGIAPFYDPNEIRAPEGEPPVPESGPPFGAPDFVMGPPDGDPPGRGEPAPGEGPFNENRFTPEERRNIRAKDPHALPERPGTAPEANYLQPNRENFFRHVQRGAVEHERGRLQHDLRSIKEHLRAVEDERARRVARDVESWDSLTDRRGSSADENVRHLDGAEASDRIKEAKGEGRELDDLGAIRRSRPREMDDLGARRANRRRFDSVDVPVDPSTVGRQLDDLGAIRRRRTRRYDSMDVAEDVPLLAEEPARPVTNEMTLDMLRKTFPGGRPRPGTNEMTLDMLRRTFPGGRPRPEPRIPFIGEMPADYPVPPIYEGPAYDRPEDYPVAPIYEGPAYDRPEDYPAVPVERPERPAAAPTREELLARPSQDQVRALRDARRIEERARRIEERNAGGAPEPVGRGVEVGAAVPDAATVDASLANEADLAQARKNAADIESKFNVADRDLANIDNGRATHQYTTRSEGERRAWHYLDKEGHDALIDTSLERATNAETAFNATPAGGPPQGTAPTSFGTEFKQQMYDQLGPTGLGVGLVAGAAANTIEQKGEHLIFGDDGFQASTDAGAATAGIVRSGVTGAITAPLAHYGTAGLNRTGAPQALGRGARAIARKAGLNIAEEAVEDTALAAGTAAAGVGLAATIPGMAVSAAAGTAADVATEAIVGAIQGDGGSKGGGYAETRMGIGAAVGGAVGGASFVPATAAAAGIFTEMTAGAAYGSLGGPAGIAAGALIGVAMGIGGYFWGKHERKEEAEAQKTADEEDAERKRKKREEVGMGSTRNRSNWGYGTNFNAHDGSSFSQYAVGFQAGDAQHADRYVTPPSFATHNSVPIAPAPAPAPAETGFFEDIGHFITGIFD